MLIKEMRVSFMQFELLAEPLRSFTPSVPFDFLLDSGKYATMYGQCLQQQGPCRAAWATGYGRRFWRIYRERESPPLKEYWDHLVPFKYDHEPALKAAWLKGNARARAYLYPWGAGVLIDMSVTEAKEFDAAVETVVGIRNANILETTFHGGAEQGTVQFLLNAFTDYVRGVAFGRKTDEGTRSELFMIVTVLDAEGVDPNVAVDNDLRKKLNGLARGIQNWSTATPPPANESTVGTGPASPGNILFATKRGRAVWYPDSFRSVHPRLKNRLRCYHQNLTAATLQTEALCMFASDAAILIDGGNGRATWVPNYDQCGRRAAGLLGRLIGGKGTYRSQSPQKQIQSELYVDSVKSLRGEYMP
jgi:hypothetical protein